MNGCQRNKSATLHKYEKTPIVGAWISYTPNDHLFGECFTVFELSSKGDFQIVLIPVIPMKESAIPAVERFLSGTFTVSEDLLVLMTSEIDSAEYGYTITDDVLILVPLNSDNINRDNKDDIEMIVLKAMPKL